MYFDVFKNPDGASYYFVAKGDNNEPVLTSESYTSKQSALNAVDMFKREASEAKVFDETGESSG
jgi:uncharacterized protein YegP (UPF0339 family)